MMDEELGKWGRAGAWDVGLGTLGLGNRLSRTWSHQFEARGDGLITKEHIAAEPQPKELKP